jgi:ethanolamine utilization cobalamin adenosyltransferase
MATTSGTRQKAPEVSIPQATHVIPTVKELMQDQSFYIRLCEEQSEVFRQNIEEFTREYNIYTKSAEVAKPSQNWQPAPQDRDKFIAEMKRRCQEVPKSIAE